MSRILIREGAALRVSGFLFKAVVQAVLFFISETWVVTSRMGKALGGFQAQVVIQLTVWLLWRTLGGKWTYTLAAAAREKAGFVTTEEYIRRHQNTVAQYIATQSLLDLCEGLESAPGAQVGMRWWEQAVLYLAGAREAAAVAVEGGGGEE